MAPIDTAKADARNAAKGLAARAEHHHPAAAACIVLAKVPRIEEGELVLEFEPATEYAFHKLKPLERDLDRYTDLRVRVEMGPSASAATLRSL